MCGEQSWCHRNPVSSCGSSPRVRGTASHPRGFCNHGRFIPACAGNSTDSWSSQNGITVHPRVCGEQGDGGFGGARPPGSSPRVRGTDCRQRCVCARCRFIPACAGNRYFHTRTTFLNPVHPRVCGEQPSLQPPDLSPVGSSPRVRGTVGGQGCRIGGRRFIPACAGNRPGCRLPRATATVHPRVCGEQLACALAAPLGTGSSPRVRGTAISGPCLLADCRFIPACAGNRPKAKLIFYPTPVHPRVCGEQLIHVSL